MRKNKFGYYRRRRIRSLIRSILCLAAVLIIYFGALHYFGTNRNVFSIIAAVCALPAGMSIVETIMLFRARTASDQVRRAVEEAGRLPEGTSGFDFYLTTYERAFSLSHAAAGRGLLIGLTEDQATDCQLCGRHISQMLEKDGNMGYQVRIYRDRVLYADALRDLAGEEDAAPGAEVPEEEAPAGGIRDREKDRRAIALLGSISL